MQRGQKRGKNRREIYQNAWALAQGMPPFEARDPDMRGVTPQSTGPTVPHLNEPWYC